MIKVLIAEDELPLLRGIKYMIESINPHFQVVMSAKNGKEAINYLEEKNVDVVFTDINMPIVDGIEVLQYIFEHKFHTQSVVISGYDEFSYAKAALTNGAKNYILKPIDPKELTDLLYNLEADIEKRSYRQKRELLTNLLFGKNKKVMENPFQSSLYLIYLCAGSLPVHVLDELTPANEYWHNKNLECMCKSFISERENIWIFWGKSLNEMIVVLELLESTDIQMVVNSLYHCFTDIIPVTLCYSPTIDHISNLKNTCNLLRTHIRDSCIFGHPSIINRNERKEQLSLSIPQEGKIQYAIHKGSFDELKLVLYELKETVKNQPITQKSLEYILKQILMILQTEYKNYGLNNLDTGINELLLYASDINQLFEDYLVLCKDIFHGKVMNNSLELMKNLDEYIRSNINKPLTTKMLSAKFGLVAPYLSKLFKDYKGVTPSQYIQTIRLDSAKELLIQCPNILAKDIADMLGYTNALYFSKTFKKNIGMYPSEYRAQHKLKTNTTNEFYI